MSKSPNPLTHLFLPALGVAALVLAVAYGWATTGYGNDRIEMLTTTLETEREAAGEEAARAQELEQALAERVAELAAVREDADARIGAAERELADLRAQTGSGVILASADGTTPAAAPTPAPSEGARLGLGREAHPEELAAWDVDVLPDGRGLPEGSGDVFTGEEVFAENCASCHGDFAEGRDNWPPLAGGFDTLDNRDPVKTVGSYWPYLSTVWDYVHRSMPFGAAGTLTDDEVYAITAYILYSNDLVDDDFTLSKDTFLDVEMYNTDGFVVDDRPETEYTAWRAEPCMENCKPAAAEITRRATDVGVTPADDGSMAQSVMEQQLATMGGEEWGAETLAGSVAMMPGAETPEPVEDAQTESADPQMVAAAADDTPDPQLVAAGEKVFRKCKACHQVGAGAKNRTGPHLNDVVGRTMGGLDGFKYSGVFQEAAEENRTWDDETLAAFLAKPKEYLKGTKMAFAGLRSDDDIAAVIAYLKTAGE